MKYKFNIYCTLCHKIPSTINILNLEKFPIESNYLKYSFRTKNLYKQKIKFCSRCEHLSLAYLYDTKSFYNDGYLTSSTNSFSGRYSNDIFYEFINKNLNKKKLNILEIGGNDLYLLNKFYKQKRINKAVVIDPTTNLYLNTKKIKVIKNFFEKIKKNISFKEFKL
jgi:cyclopropane-fatty-acyl-phospholipid synthase